MSTNVLNPAESELLVSVFGQAAVSSMTLSQVKALHGLVKKCPSVMADAVTEVEEKVLIETLRHYGLSTGRGSSTSWRTLLSAVSDVLPSVYQLSKEDSTTLLNGLCKSIRSQVVSIPLFLALIGAWKSASQNVIEQGGVSSPGTTTGASPGTKQAEAMEKRQTEERFKEISSTLNLCIPDLMYIFDLIRERLSVELTHISTSSNSITMTEFELMLRKSRTVIDPTKLDKLIVALMSSAVGAPGVPVPAYGDRYEIVDKSGNLDASNLLAFSMYVEQGHIFQLPGYRTKKEKTMQTRISTHLLRAVKKAWPVAHARLVASKTATVTAKDFERKLREGGTLLSTDDLERIWEAVSIGVGIGAFDGISAEVTLDELDTFVQGFVEVDKDPRSFVMMQLMDKGEGEHHLRKMQEGPHGVFNHNIDLTWSNSDGGGDDDGARINGAGVLASKKRHFEKKKAIESGGGLPWEETYTEAGHDQSQQEAVLRQKTVNAQRHHYGQGDTDVSLPWMDQFQNEGTSSTNLQRRITMRVHGLSQDMFQKFVSALKRYAHTTDLNARRGVTAGRALAPEDAVDYTHVSGSEIVSRVTLRESLAEAGVFCTPADSSDLFLNIARYCAGFNRRVKAGSGIDTPVTITEVFRWMGAAHGVGECGKEVLARYAVLVGLPVQDLAASEPGADGGGSGGAAVVDDAFVNAFQQELQHGLMGSAHNPKNEESDAAAADPANGKSHYPGAEGYHYVPDADGHTGPANPSRRVNASELRGAGVGNEGPEDGVPSGLPLPPSPTKSDFIFGSETGTPSRGGKAHYSNNIFGSPYPQEDADKKMEKTRVSRAPPCRDIFGAIAAAEGGAAGGGADGTDSAWPKPLPSWQQAAAERARGGGNSANRIFGVEEQGADVLAPPPPPSAAGGAPATAAMVAARQNAGSLGGAAGAIARSADGQVGTEDVIAVLQTKRANLALVFRRLAAMSDHGSGLVKLQDFGNSLPDLVGGHVGSLLKVQPGVCWQAVCDIAGRPYTSDQNATANTIHYNDVTKFLDKVQRDAENGLNGAQIMRSLKDKCFRSRDLAGDKLKLITLTPQLRQRQKQRVLTNRSRSKGVTGAQNSYEFVNAHDLIDLFASIDLHVSTSEARWLCDQSATSDDKIGMLEPTTRLSSVVQYVSNNLLA